MNDKTVVISGASAGIGAALAHEFHGRGFRVVLLARREDRLRYLAAQLNSIRQESALPIACDVTNAEQMDRALTQVVQHFGRIDGFIANAGVGIAGKVSSLTTADYRRQFDTNVFPVVDGFLRVRSELVKRKGFYTVIGSVNSYLSLPTASAYAMSKFAVKALTDALYWEMKPEGVSVTLACPGFIETEIRKVNNAGEFREKAKDPVPVWLMMSASKAARVIARASLGRRREVWVTVHAKILILLARHVPWLLNPVMMSAAKARENWNG